MKFSRNVVCVKYHIKLIRDGSQTSNSQQETGIVKKDITDLRAIYLSICLSIYLSWELKNRTTTIANSMDGYTRLAVTKRKYVCLKISQNKSSRMKEAEERGEGRDLENLTYI